MFKLHYFLFLFWHWNLISIKSEFYPSVALTKRYECKREDGQKIVGASLQNASSHVKQSQKKFTDSEQRKMPTRIGVRLFRTGKRRTGK